MIKIKLIEKDIHRNETTFRPFLFAQNTLRDIGIEFTDSDDYDYAWVAQASIIDKEVSLEQSIEKGVNFISKISPKKNGNKPNYPNHATTIETYIGTGNSKSTIKYKRQYISKTHSANDTIPRT